MKKRYAALIFCAIGILLGSVTSEAKKKPSVTAESAIVMDVQSGAILYEKNILSCKPHYNCIDSFAFVITEPKIIYIL